MGLGARAERTERARLRVAPHVAGLLALVLLAGACGGGGGDGDSAASGEQQRTAAEEATSSTALQPCGENRHIVAFDFAGMLTASQEDWVDWINGIAEPEPRAGGPEVIQAYRDRGYEILYVTTAPPNVLINDLPVPVAVEAWLEDHGFPLGEGTQVLGYTGNSTEPNAPILSITDELLRLGGEGVSRDAGYTENADKAYAYASGGIDPAHIYMIGEEAGVAGTTAIPGDDLLAHVATVEELPEVCVAG